MDTAEAEAFLNQYDQYTPWGSITYSPTGESMTVGTGANAREIEGYRSDINLTPEGQQLLDAQNQLSLGAMTTGNQLFGNVQDAVQQPFSFDDIPQLPGYDDYGAERQRVEDAIYGRMTGRMDDRYGRAEAALEQKLANQGIQQGSDAYSAAMRDFGYGETDAYQQAMNNAIIGAGQEQQRLFNQGLAGRQQGIDEATYLRSQPVNELSALLGFSGGVQGPQFSATPQTGIQAPVPTQSGGRDYSLINGLMGLGGNIGAAMLMGSDIRIKDNIKRIGTADNGLPLYLFTYKGSDKFNIGFMAQDVEKVCPEAVIEIDGVKHVDYARATEWKAA